MRTCSDDFGGQLAADVTTLCRLWRITPTGRATIYLTDHDQPITFDGNTYASANDTFEASAIDNQLGSGQTNFEMQVLLGSLISREDCERGVYSGAYIEIDAIFYDHIDFDTMALATGQVSTVSLPDQSRAVFSCSGFASTGQHKLTELYSATCRAEFCDTRCTLHIADFTSGTLTVGSVTGSMTFFGSGLNATVGYYDLGFVEWLTGANAGRQNEVRHSTATAVGLLIRPAFQIQVGDTYKIVRGCDKTLTTCRDTYDNLVNFRGEPYAPGDDYVNKPVMSTPPGAAGVAPDPLPDTWTVP